MPAKGKSPLTQKKKAAVLAFAAIAETKTEAAKLAGVSRATVINVLAEAESNPELRDARDNVKKTLDQKFEVAIDKAIDSIILDAGNAKIRDSAQVCALVDKMRLLRGEATSITQSLSPEQRKARILELVQKAS